MGYINSKKYDGIQLYHKANKDVSYYIRYKDEDGKLKRIKIGDKSKGITEPYCFQKRNEVINAIKLGGDMPIKYKKEKGITFDEVASQYLEHVKLYSSEKTYKEAEGSVRLHLSKFLADKEIIKVSITDLEYIQKERVKTHALKTVNQFIELFGTIFNYGLKKELYNASNPSTKVKKFKVNNSRDRYLSSEDIEELHKNIKGNNLLELFIHIGLITGGRMETILHIQKKDIDLENQVVTLQDLKNKDTYKGFLSEKATELIKAKKKLLKANDYVVSLDGSKTTPRQIQSRLKPILDKLFNKELESKDAKNRVVVHTLRHTFASHLAINGTPIFTIQKLMNHRDIKMTMRYAKLAPDSGKNFVEKLYL